MKKIIVEIDGQRHRLVEDKANASCKKCSLDDICCEDGFNTFCDLVGNNGCYFRKEE